MLLPLKAPVYYVRCVLAVVNTHAELHPGFTLDNDIPRQVPGPPE